MTRQEAVEILKGVVSWRYDHLRGHAAFEYIAEAVEVLLRELNENKEDKQ